MPAHVSTTRRLLLSSLVLILFSALAFSILSPQVAHAATLTINSIADTDDPTPNDSVCDVGGGVCTLRAAIETANGTGNPGADTITFDSTVFSSAKTILLGSDLPAILDDTTISGPGANKLTIDGASSHAVFATGSGTTVSISGMTIQNAKSMPGLAGAAMFPSGDLLTVDHVSFLNNNAPANGGGALWVNDGTAVITNSTFEGNSTGGTGGAINVPTGGTLYLINSTMKGNSSSSGGAIAGSGPVYVINSTITNNTTTNVGGGAVGGVTVTIDNSIIAGNAGGDCYDATVVNFSLIGDGGIGSCAGARAIGSGNLTGAAGLGALTGNPAFYPLIATSPAINAGSNALAVDQNNNPLTTDEAGNGRIFAGQVDMGAYEDQQADCPAFPYTVPASDSGLLEYAMACANGNGTNDVINLTNSTYTLSFVNNPVNSTGLPLIPSSPIFGTLTINGNGATIARSSAAGTPSFGIFYNSTFGILSLNDLTLSNGKSPLFGSGILNGGTLTLTNTTFSGDSNNTPGGGIYNTGTTSVTGSIFTGNSASVGGAIVNSATLTVVSSTFSGNSATTIGGGAIIGNGTTTIIDSTFTNNSATIEGGAILNSGTMRITNSTLSGNSSSSVGGGLYSGFGGTLNFNNSIAANNSGGDCTLAGGTINVRNSLIGDGLSCVNGTNSNNLTGNPMLGTLTGSPAYYPLLNTSIAINEGSNALAVDPSNNPLTTDEAGNARIYAGQVDMGAYEAQQADCPTFPYTVPASASDLLEYAIACANGNGVNTNDTINLTKSTYTLNVVNNSGGLGSNGLPEIADKALDGTLIIDGHGATIARSSAISTPQFRIFYTDGDSDLTLNNLTLTGGSSDGAGGAIFMNSVLTINNSTVSNNTAIGAGGGLLVNSGIATIRNSTFDGNQATGNGGGINLGFCNCTGLNLMNSTISNNQGSTGGGVVAAGPSTIINSTIVNNHATDATSGIAVVWDTELDNSIVSDSTGADCTLYGGTLTVQFTLVSDGSCITSGVNGNLSGSAGLGAQTGNPAYYPLLNTSIAINAGSNALAVDPTNGGAAIPFDERGTGFPRIVDSTVDLGSFESEGVLHLVFVDQPTTTPANTSITPAVTVEVEDSTNTVVSGDNGTQITLAFGNDASGGTATLSGTLTETVVNGVATFDDLSIDKVGTDYTLAATDATDNTVTGDTSGTFDITSGADSQLVFDQQPNNAVAGTAISPAVTVKIEDASGNQTDSTADVTIAIDTNPGSGTLGGTLTVAAVNGEATFSDLSIDKIGTGYTLQATSAGLTSTTSGTFNITPGADSQLVFMQQPNDAVAGIAISPAVTVKIEDSFGNLTTSTADVTLAIDTDPSGGTATLSGTLPVAAVGGVATFTDLSIDKVGTGYTLQATSAALTSIPSNSFNITPGVAAQLAFVQQPNTTAAGLDIMPAVTVQIEDAFGNLIMTDSTDTVTVAFSTNPSSATLSGNLTVTLDHGVATFSDLNIDKIGSGYKLGATTSASGVASDTSGLFDITLGTAAKVAFVDQPTNTVAGLDITPAVTVAVEDSGGNVLTTDNSTQVILNIGANPGGGTLGGGLTETAVNGVATFSDLVIDNVGNNYTLTANAASLTGDTSAFFNITAASCPVFPVTLATGDSAGLINAVLCANSNGAGTDDMINLTSGTPYTLTQINNADDSRGNNGLPSVAAASAEGKLTINGGGATITYNSAWPFRFFYLQSGADLTINDVVFSQSVSDGSGGAILNFSGTLTVTDSTFSNNQGGGNGGAISNFTGTATITDSSFAGNSAAGNGGSIYNEGTMTVTGSTASGGTGTSGGGVFNDDDGTLTLINSTFSANTGRGLGGGIFNDNVLTITNSTISANSAGGGGNIYNSEGTLTLNNSIVANAVKGGDCSNSATITIQYSLIKDGSCGITNGVNGNIVADPLLGALGNNGGTTQTMALGAGSPAINAGSNALAVDASSNPLTTDQTGSPRFVGAVDMGAVEDQGTQKLVFTTEPPATVTTDSTFGVVVSLETSGGSVITSDSTTQVTIALDNDPSSGTATFGGTLTATVVNGVVTFSGLNINTVANGYTLKADATSTTEGSSSAINVVAATTHLTFIKEPSNTAVSATITPAVKVEIDDALNTVISSDNTTQITLSIDANPGGGLLGGTLTATAVNGVATFSDLSIDKAGAGYTLMASSNPIFTGATSDLFNITSGAPASTAIPAIFFECQNLDTQTGGAMTSDGGIGAVHSGDDAGNVYCHVIAKDGNYVTDSAEIGVGGVLNLGVEQAVDVFGELPGGYSVVPFDRPVQICLQGSGEVVFLDAATAERTVERLGTVQQGSYLCVSLTGSGTLVLVSGASGLAAPPPAPTAAPTLPASTTLTECRVTTTNAPLNLRADPSTTGTVLAQLPYNITLTATAYVSGWYNVIYLDGQGWVSATYLSFAGECGQ